MRLHEEAQANKEGNKEGNSHQLPHAVGRVQPRGEGGDELRAVDGDAGGVELAAEVGADRLVVAGALDSDEGRGERVDGVALGLEGAGRREDGVPGRDEDGGAVDDAAELDLRDGEAVHVEEEGLRDDGLGHVRQAREERDEGGGVDEGEGLRLAGGEVLERDGVGRQLARHRGVDACLGGLGNCEARARGWGGWRNEAVMNGMVK